MVHTNIPTQSCQIHPCYTSNQNICYPYTSELPLVRPSMHHHPLALHFTRNTISFASVKNPCFVCKTRIVAKKLVEAFYTLLGIAWYFNAQFGVKPFEIMCQHYNFYPFYLTGPIFITTLAQFKRFVEKYVTAMLHQLTTIITLVFSTVITLPI